MTSFGFRILHCFGWVDLVRNCVCELSVCKNRVSGCNVKFIYRCKFFSFFFFLTF
jgi:hypothetical protein